MGFKVRNTMTLYNQAIYEFNKHLFMHRKEVSNIKINILHMMFGRRAKLWEKINDNYLYYFFADIVRVKTIKMRPGKPKRSFRRIS
jgi:hypothetical protein